MNDLLRPLRNFFASITLTVVLLAFGMILVFAATLDQVNLGIWAVQEKYFRSFFVMWHAGEIPVPVFPGGYLVGGLLLINLLTSHVTRFKLIWRRSGIFLTHVGLILLLVGELLSGLWQEDFSLRFEEGENRNYAESYRANELYLTDVTDAKFDDVVAIPEKLLAKGDAIQHAKLPFRVVPKIYYPNTSLQRRGPQSTPSPATAGFGLNFAPMPMPLTYKQDERNLPAAFIELVGSSGTPVGTWLVTTDLPMPQHFEFEGRSWKIGLRSSRTYQPFSLTLLKFSHDRYAGTDIPKNFSSRIRLQTPDGRDDREVLIYMNNPLRYAGLTFYQASFDPSNDKVTVLQVVRNPSWQLPYIACALMAFGLLAQFCIHLAGFVGKRRVAAPAV